MSDLGRKHSCTVINSNIPPVRNIQHPDPETIFPPPAPYRWLNMTPLPCVGWERADRTQRAIWFRGNFTCFLFLGGFAWTTTGKFLSLPGARHFRDAVFQSSETQHFPNNLVRDATAMVLVLVERAEPRTGVQSHPRVLARGCPHWGRQSFPELGSIWASVSGVTCQVTWALGILGTLNIYQTHEPLQTTLQVERISAAVVPANTEIALDKGLDCCSSVKYIVFLKPR